MLRLRVAVVVAGITLASIFASTAFGDGIANLSVLPTLTTLNSGDSFVIDVNISDVTDIYDFQFDLSFNPAVLQSTNISEGDFLSSGGTTFFIPGAIDNSVGTITFNANTLLTAISGVDGNGALVEFDFKAFAPGTSLLSISNVMLQDSSQVGTDSTLPNTTTNASVTVQGTTTVPEPSSMLLLVAGFLALKRFALNRSFPTCLAD